MLHPKKTWIFNQANLRTSSLISLKLHKNRDITTLIKLMEWDGLDM